MLLQSCLILAYDKYLHLNSTNFYEETFLVPSSPLERLTTIHHPAPALKWRFAAQ